MHEFDELTARLERAFNEFSTRHPKDAGTVDRFLELLSDGEPAFHRTHTPGHFTASSVVLSHDLGQVLLTHHRKLDIWIQLGGHADGDADLLRAAEREALEESGLPQVEVADAAIADVDIHTIPPHGGEPGHDHYDVRYAFLADPAAPIVVSDESHDLAWVRIERLGEFSREESLHRAVRRATELAGGSERRRGRRPGT